MAKSWFSNDDAGLDDYDEIPIEPEQPNQSDPPDKQKDRAKSWVIIVGWIISLLISVGISFIIFLINSDDAGEEITIWYIIQNSGLLANLGLVLFAILTSYLIEIYKKKGLFLDIRDSQFIINLAVLLLACIDVFLYRPIETNKESTFKIVIWFILVISSCILCVTAQTEFKNKKK